MLPGAWDNKWEQGECTWKREPGFDATIRLFMQK